MAAVPTPDAGVCRVWWARPADLRPEHDVLLAPADRQRLGRLARAADRQRAGLAAVLARLVLAAGTGTAPAELAVDRTCPQCGAPHGKPRLTGVPDLHFSVAHSGDCVAVAVLLGREVGVDVEQLGRFSAAELDRVAELVLAPEERADLAARPAAARVPAFTGYWARKEAVVKATGEGVGTALDRLVVSPPPSPARVLRAEGAPVVLHDLHPPDGYAAALAVVGTAPVRIEERDAGPLLGAAAGQSSRRLPAATTRSQR